MTDLVTRLILKTGQFDSNLAKSTLQVKQFKGYVQNAKQGFSSFLGGAGMGGLLSFASVTGALAVLGSQFKKCIDNAKEFESSLSHLKATFNLSADAMDKLSNSAMATGRATAKSASDIANAYMMVGSKIPTLKQQPEALDYVTKSAITLSKAGLIPLEDATNILSTSLNTMGLNVESTDQVINTLAAGAQKGSANIDYLGTAISKSGSVASNFGISIQQLVAAIETVAPKVSDAGEAGTGLRNVFLALEKQSDDNLKPSVVGLQTALENLSGKTGDTNYMMSLFGKRNIVVATALINGADKCRQFTSAVNDDSAATNEAATNTNNLDGMTTKLSSDWDNMLTSVGNTSIWKDAITYVDQLVSHISDLAASTSDLTAQFGGKATTDLIGAANKAIKKYEQQGLKRDQAIKKVKGLISSGKFYVKDQKEKYSSAISTNAGFNATGIGILSTGLNLLGVFKHNNSINTPAIRKSAMQGTLNYLNGLSGSTVANSGGSGGYIPTKSSHPTKVNQNNNQIKTVLQTYESELNALLEKKQNQIKLGLDTTQLDKEINDKKQQIEKFKLNLIDDSTYEGLKEKLQQLQKLQTLSVNSTDWNNYQKQIDEVQGKINDIDGTVKIKVDKDSEAGIRQQIDEIQEKIESTSDIQIKLSLIVDKTNLEDKLKEVQQAVDSIYKPKETDQKYKTDNTFNYKSSPTDIIKSKYEAQKSYYDDMIDYNKQAANSLKFTDDELQKQYQKVQNLKEMWDTAQINEDVANYKKEVNSLRYDTIMNSVSTVTSLAGSWKSLGETLNSDASAFDKVTAVINTVVSTVEGVVQVISLIQSLSTATSLLSSATNSSVGSKSEEAVATVATTAAEAMNIALVPEVIAATTAKTLAVDTLTASYTKLAVAEYMAAHAYIPFTGYGIGLGFSIAAKATIASAGIVGAFANGGIVDGSSYYGDKLLARVNSGEMILNGKQQGNLFNMINNSSESKSVEFKIRGKDLVGAISNYNAIKSTVK